MRVVLLTLPILLASCLGGISERLPRRLRDLPERSGERAERLAEARRLQDRGSVKEALEMAEQIVREAPNHVDAQRLRQDLLRQRGRVGLVLHEAEQRLEAQPNDAVAHYLAGRVGLEAATRREHFERAIELRPDGFWGWLGFAFSLRGEDPEGALEIYRELLQVAEYEPLVGLGYARALLAADEPERAVAVYLTLREGVLSPGLAAIGLASCYADLGLRVPSWRKLMAALRLRPEDPAVHALLRLFQSSGLPPEQAVELFDVLDERADLVERFLAVPGAGETLAKAAPLAEQESRITDLRERAVRAPRADAAARRALRRDRLGRGDFAGWLAALRETLPPSLLEDPSNRVRGLWIALWSGPWMDAERLERDPEIGLELLDAIAACGLLPAAARYASWLERRHPEHDLVAERVASLRRDLAFLRGVSRALERTATKEDADLDTLLEELRIESERVLGKDVVGTPRRYEVPFAGELFDPFGPGLPEFFRRYNLHLVLGAKSGSVPEGMALNRVSVRDLDDDGLLPLPGESIEVIGDERLIDDLRGMLGGDLAGVALFGHYVIDLDAVRAWAATVLRQRRIQREDGEALLADPLPQDIEPLQPVDASWRLVAMSPLQDSEILFGVLDMIRWHERAHLADSFLFLPPERHLWPLLGLLLRGGFQPLAIESELEGRAETAALAFAVDPLLVLAHIAGFLERNVEGSPHAAGFRQLARYLCDEMSADPDLAPYARVSRWHLAPPERLRDFARARAASFWSTRVESPATSDTDATKIR